MLHVDNQSAIAISCNPEHHGRMQHLDLCVFWLCNTVQISVLTPVFVATVDQAADILTKPLSRELVVPLSPHAWTHHLEMCQSRGEC